MSSQIDTDGFQQVKSKRGPGPRGQRKNAKEGSTQVRHKRLELEQTSQDRRKNAEAPTEAPRERLSFKDLLFERNNLKKHEHSPKVDLWEEKDEQGSYYVIRMEIPGVNKNKINIDIKENQIVLVTAFKSGDKPDPESVVYSECRYGKIIRRVKVPNQIYEENVRTKYEDGVLKIELVQIPVEEKVETLDASLDDEPVEQTMGAQVLYSSLVKNETVKTETVIDFKDLSLATGNWADEPVESKSWADM
jgi:HSP20 family molecular chaperone IbpA